jgi:hypothetical protein
LPVALSKDACLCADNSKLLLTSHPDADEYSVLGKIMLKLKQRLRRKD